MSGKYCVDCENHRDVSAYECGDDAHLCVLTEEAINIVTGKPNKTVVVCAERRKGSCKEEGVFFKSKEG